MAKAEWVELGGHRLAWGEIRAHTVTEYRCDVCGEFLAVDEAVTLHSARLVQAGAPEVYVPDLHFHAAHLPAVLVPFLTEGR